MVSLYFHASGAGFLEMIRWDHENEPLSLTKGQDRMIANFLGTAISLLPYCRRRSIRNRFFKPSLTTVLEYFFRANLSVATEVELGPKDPPWTTTAGRKLGDSSLAKASSHRATLRDVLVTSLLRQPRREMWDLCLGPFPPVFEEVLRVFIKYGATFWITMGVPVLYRPRPDECDPIRDIRPVLSHLEDKNDHDDSNSHIGRFNNSYSITDQSEYQLRERINIVIQDEDDYEMLLFDHVIGSSPEQLRSFWELLVSSGGWITLRDFLHFTKCPSFDMSLSPLDPPDGGFRMTPSSSSPEAILGKADTPSNKDSANQAPKQPGFFSLVSVVVVMLASILADFLPTFR
ncbi:hypothetical protein B0J18DRAFT_419821 [Chaetomium sp. MPI-SDFR-AT-0129]|nr:hypothetical protein B0J18DRAFT_419821 [Chaetomium sp. MPI-SDFR-AT-0129]